MSKHYNIQKTILNNNIICCSWFSGTPLGFIHYIQSKRSNVFQHLKVKSCYKLLVYLMTYISLLFVSPSIDAQLLFNNVHRVVFLGNSITYGGTYINDIEAYFITHYPQQNFEFISVGLSSETVSGLSEEGHAGGKFPRPDLHERLDRVLQMTKPDLVFACYGMNDGIYLPFDKSRFQKYKDGINWLHDAVVKTGATIVHITPPFYDELKGGKKGYDATLDKYADWLIAQKKERSWKVVDIHYPMKNFVAAHRKVDSLFGISSFALAEDGVHPGEAGHWIMAKQVLLYLGESKVKSMQNIHKAVALVKNGEDVLKLVSERQAIMRDAWLTAIGHKRPGVKIGLPLPEAQAKYKEIETKIRSLLN